MEDNNNNSSSSSSSVVVGCGGGGDGGTNIKLESFFLDNIIVGYAFGPKKMDTMGLIMAEASKALSTVECSWITQTQAQQKSDNGHGGVRNDYSKEINIANNHKVLQNTPPEESSVAVTAPINPHTTTPRSLTGSIAAATHLFSDSDKDYGDYDDDARSISSTVTRWSSSCGTYYSNQQQLHNNNSNNKRSVNEIQGIQLIFRPDTDGFLDLMRTASASAVPAAGTSGGGESVAESSSVVTISTTLPASLKLNHREVLGGVSTAAPGSATSLSPQKLSRKSEPMSLSSHTNNQHQHQQQHHHPIPVSFVPIDLDSPLEEQHGGKFDVILHKLTEDILCFSKMLQQQRQQRQQNEKNKNSVNEEVDGGIFTYHHSNSNNNMNKRQARASQRIQRLSEYKNAVHPACVLVDPPTNILAVMSRADMANVLQRCLEGVVTKSGVMARTPWYRVVSEDAILDTEPSASLHQNVTYLANEITKSGIEYPLIAKPLSAAGIKSSHHMGIVLARDGLQRLKTPCILQEYANHGGRIFKVYVLGESVWVFARESLPNLPIGETKHISSSISPTPCSSTTTSSNDTQQQPNNSRGRKRSYVEFERLAGSRFYVEFDSQLPYPKLADFGIDEIRFSSSNKQPCVEDVFITSHINQDDVHDNSMTVDSYFDYLASFVTKDELEPVTNALRDAFGLELFGYDVIVKHDQGSLTIDRGSEVADKTEILVVDVNYFPGYKEVPNFPSLLAQYLTQKAVESRVRNSGTTTTTTTGASQLVGVTDLKSNEYIQRKAVITLDISSLSDLGSAQQQMHVINISRISLHHPDQCDDDAVSSGLDDGYCKLSCDDIHAQKQHQISFPICWTSRDKTINQSVEANIHPPPPFVCIVKALRQGRNRLILRRWRQGACWWNLNTNQDDIDCECSCHVLRGRPHCDVHDATASTRNTISMAHAEIAGYRLARIALDYHHGCELISMKGNSLRNHVPEVLYFSHDDDNNFKSNDTPWALISYFDNHDREERETPSPRLDINLNGVNEYQKIDEGMDINHPMNCNATAPCYHFPSTMTKIRHEFGFDEAHPRHGRVPIDECLDYGMMVLRDVVMPIQSYFFFLSSEATSSEEVLKNVPYIGLFDSDQAVKSFHYEDMVSVFRHALTRLSTANARHTERETSVGKIDSLLQMLEQCVNALGCEWLDSGGRHPPLPPVLCHMDLQPQNLVFRSASDDCVVASVMDWEEACYCDPRFEILLFCRKVLANRDQADKLWQTYSLYVQQLCDSLTLKSKTKIRWTVGSIDPWLKLETVHSLCTLLLQAMDGAGRSPWETNPELWGKIDRERQRLVLMGWQFCDYNKTTMKS